MISGGCVASVFFVLPHTAAHIATALATRITPNICAVANKALRLQSASPHTSLIRRAIHRRNTRYTKYSLGRKGTL